MLGTGFLLGRVGLRSFLEDTKGDGASGGADSTAGRMAAWKNVSRRHYRSDRRGRAAGAPFSSFLSQQGGSGESRQAARVEIVASSAANHLLHRPVEGLYPQLFAGLTKTYLLMTVFSRGWRG